MWSKIWKILKPIIIAMAGAGVMKAAEILGPMVVK